MSKLWRGWSRFATWFDQTPVQLTYSGLACLGGVGFFLTAKTPILMVLGLALILSAILNAVSVLSRSSGDASNSDRD